jgi:nitrite reductase (NADH) large subunit
MGVALERRLEFLQMPAEINIAVSASPRHRAGTLAKDIGIVGVPGGWEIYVGGSMGMRLRQGELLGVETSDEKVMELVEAFLQGYREEARYGESAGQWVERKGMIQLREALFHLQTREGLIARLNNEILLAKEQKTNLQPSAALTR